MNKNPELAIRIGVDAKDSIATLGKLDTQYSGLVRSLKGRIGKIAALEDTEAGAKKSAVALEEARRKVEFFKRSAEIGGAAGMKAYAKDIAAAKKEALAAAAAGEKQRLAIASLRQELTAAGIDTGRLAAEQARLAAQMRATESLQAKTRMKVGLLGTPADTVAAVSQAGKIKAGVDSISASLARAQKAYLLFQGAQSVALSLGNLAHRSDEYLNYTARLKLATRSAAEFGAAQADVSRIALAAQAPVAAVANLYARMATPLREMGRSQRDAAAVTETMALALKVSGASTAEQASVMLQLSQAFASGVLRGEEFNAMMENGPRLAKLLADGLGVPVGQLRQMAEDGKITSEMLARVFTSQSALEQLRAEVAQLPLTIGGASQQLSDAFTVYIGQAGAASGATQKLASGIQALAGNFSGVADAAIYGGIAATTVGVIGLGARLLQAAKAAGTARLALLALSAHPLVLLATAAAAMGIAYAALKDDEEALTAARRKSAEALRAELDRTMQYKDALILAGEAVDKLATKEVQAYADRMKGAADYYHALYVSEVKRNGPDGAEALRLAAQRDVYVKAMADLKPILAARLKLEKDHSGALKLTQEELTPQIKAALDAQTKVYQDAAKAVEEAQKKRRDALKAQADFEKKLLAGPEKKAEEKTLADFDAGTAAARQAAVAGDTETALKGVEALRAQLLAMKEAGAESGLVLSGLARSVAEIENLALAKGEEKVRADREKAFNDLLTLQNMAKSLEAIKIGVDQPAAEKALQTAQAALQTFADQHPIIQRVIVQAQEQSALDANYTAPKKAAGGLITGPGSDTSDNLLAWLSPGEFVLRAAAVRKWGADRLAALNAGRMPQFAAGGLVTRAVSSLPRYAEGGMVAAGGLQPINLTLPGLGTWAMRAEPAVARDFAAVLRREAMKRGG